MRRSRLMIVEPLEGKALMSPLAVAASRPAVAKVNHSLTVVLTTNQRVYPRGGDVVMTLTVTNASTQTQTVALGPSVDGFYVTSNGRPVWASNTGPQALFLQVRTLAPGASLSLTATWNGHSTFGPPALADGRMLVHSQIAGAPAVAIKIRAA